jgi:flagellar biosynthesis protein FlhG
MTGYGMLPVRDIQHDGIKGVVMNISRISSLRHGPDAHAERATVLTITSGKGGVGKTNIAANLSICLAKACKRVLLMDADLGLGNLDVVMNLNNRYNLGHVLTGRKTVEDVIQLTPEGVEVICGGSGIEELANISPFQRQRLVDELDRLQHRADVIVIDTGAGIHASVVGFCMASDHTLVVTTPEPTAMTDAYAMIKILAGKKYPGRISLLVNMADSLVEGRKTYRQIAEVAARFLNTAVYDGGVLCRDELVGCAVRRREPVVLAYPRSVIADCFAAISARIGNIRRPETESTGFFKKVVNWLF